MCIIFKVIIAGSRNFDNYEYLRNTMDYFLKDIREKEIVEIVCGKAKGADTLGEQYALERGYKIKYFPADWDRYGKRAGYLRNEQMADYADALVAFWDGKTKGTKIMIELAQKYQLKIRIKKY